MSDSALTQVVILGASGDLTARKLIPGLFTSYRDISFPILFRWWVSRAVLGMMRHFMMC